MAAFQATTASQTLLAADPDQWRTIAVSNLGPNAIYLETTGAAATATGLPVATNGFVTFGVPPGVTVTVIAATATQTTPADTRYVVY